MRPPVGWCIGTSVLISIRKPKGKLPSACFETFAGRIRMQREAVMSKVSFSPPNSQRLNKARALGASSALSILQVRTTSLRRHSSTAAFPLRSPDGKTAAKVPVRMQSYPMSEETLGAV